jgi:hypothetical protein
VVLRPAAHLYDAPEGTLRARSPQTLHASAKLLRATDDWLQIASSGAPGRCTVGFDPIWNVELRLWVPRAELAPVVEHELELDFDDGTGITIAAGTPVELDGEGRPVAILSGATRLELASEPSWEDAVGWRFESALLEEAYARRILPEHTSPELAGQPLPPELFDRIQAPVIAGPKHPPPDPWPTPRLLVQETWEARGGEGVVLAGACVRARAIVPRRARLDPRPEDLRWALVYIWEPKPYEPDLVSDHEERWRVKAGAQATWPDGAPAGSVDENWHVDFAPPGRVVDGRRCFPTAVRLQVTGADLCFEQADLELLPAEPLGPGGGGGYG